MTTHGPFTFDTQNGADADRFIYDSPTQSAATLPAAAGTARNLCHDTDGGNSTSVGPDSGQGGSPDGYLYTEASSPGANGDVYTILFDTTLDASAEQWQFNFYTCQRGPAIGNNQSTCVVQINESGGGWTTVSGGSFGGSGDDTTTSTWVSRSVDLSESGANTDSSTQVRILITSQAATTWHADYGIDTIEIVGTPLAGITSVTPDEFDYDATSVVAAGVNFGSTQSTGTIYISDASTLAGSANEVDVSSAVTAWNDTGITLNLTNLSAGELASLQTLGPGARFVIVLTAASDEYSSAVTTHRPQAFEMVLGSATPGSTTQRLTGMSGTFGGGRIEETAAQNPSTTTTDVAADGNREDVWSIQAKALSREVSYDFRVLYDGNVADTITQTPQVTVAAGGPVTHATSGALTGQGSTVSGAATRTRQHATSGDLVGQGSAIIGAASSATTRPSSGALTGQGSAISGSAARTRVHEAPGVLVGSGSTIAGSAAHIAVHGTAGVLVGQGAVIAGTATRFRAFATSGVLAGEGSAIVGAASRSAGAVTHDTSGALVGDGSVVAGTATRFRAFATEGVLAGQGAAIVGTAAHIAVHTTTGILTGQGADLAGIAARFRAFDTDGVLVGQGSTIVGTAARLRAFDTSGLLTGQGAVIVGAAARFRAFDTDGVLVGQGSAIVGTAAHIAIHLTTGVLAGDGAVVVGAAARTGAAPDHATTGALVGSGAAAAGTAARFRAFDTNGVLIGQGAVIVGAASSATARPSTGALVGQGATSSGTAARLRVFDTSGALTGQGTILVGAAQGSGAPSTSDYRMWGMLVNPGTLMNRR